MISLLRRPAQPIPPATHHRLLRIGTHLADLRGALAALEASDPDAYHHPALLLLIGLHIAAGDAADAIHHHLHGDISRRMAKPSAPSLAGFAPVYQLLWPTTTNGPVDLCRGFCSPRRGGDGAKRGN